MKAFGIGCWSLEPRGDDLEGLQFDEGGYREAVLKTLRAIPTVKNATATEFHFGYVSGQSDEEVPAEPIEKFEHVLRRLRFRPHPFTGRISFDIEIPASFAEVSPRFALRLTGSDQRFSVEIRYTENFPVAFITTESGSEHGSNALVVVREFILHELKMRDTPLELKVLGPSPFWADCSVECGDSPQDEKTEAIEYERLPRRLGYDTIRFICMAKNDDELSALNEVFDYIEPELGLYYQTVNWEGRRIANWRALQHELDSLVALHESNAVKTVMARWAKAGRLSRRLSLSLLKEQARASEYARRGIEEQEKIYAMTSSRIFKMDLDKRIDLARTDYPAAQGMVTHLDARRRYDVNLAALVLSSTLGGVAGAAITAIVGG